LLFDPGHQLMALVVGMIIHHQNQAYAFALATVLLWSTVAVAFKLALRQIDVFQLVFYSTLAASIILACISWAQGSISTIGTQFKNHWKMTILSGCINPVLYYLVLFAAYDRLPAQVAQPINYTWAIVLTFLSIPFLRQRMTWGDLIAAFVCYSGVVVIATQGQFSISDLWANNLALENLASIDQEVWEGLFFAILSTFIWAGYWILNVRDPRQPAIAICLNFLVALPVSFIVCLIFSSPVLASNQSLIFVGYIGFAEMAVAFLLWSKALKMAENTSRVSNLIFLSPFLSLIFIHLLLDETIHSTTYFGLLVIVAGLLFQQYSRLKHEAVH
jgi:drug/metabolite transporter (DMT)-like permease